MGLPAAVQGRKTVSGILPRVFSSTFVCFLESLSAMEYGFRNQRAKAWGDGPCDGSPI
jgi:hypothetical protein